MSLIVCKSVNKSYFLKEYEKSGLDKSLRIRAKHNLKWESGRKKIAIGGLPRGGTRYMAFVLYQCGLDVYQENYDIDSDGHVGFDNFLWDGTRDDIFVHWYQTREPLKQMRSYMMRAWLQHTNWGRDTKGKKQTDIIPNLSAKYNTQETKAIMGEEFIKSRFPEAALILYCKLTAYAIQFMDKHARKTDKPIYRVEDICLGLIKNIFHNIGAIQSERFINMALINVPKNTHTDTKKFDSDLMWDDFKDSEWKTKAMKFAEAFGYTTKKGRYE